MPRLDDLRRLTYGWDGDNAEPPTAEAINLAEELCSTHPVALPAEDGGVKLEWRNRAQALLLEIKITDGGTLELE